MTSGVQTVTLTEFLLARIAEDEAVAKAAGRPEELYPYGDKRLNPFASEKVPDAVRGYLGGSWGEHFARWPMARVLAECEAKRRIVEEASEQAPYLGSWGSVLQWLAAPYADHPDYREEWAV